MMRPDRAHLTLLAAVTAVALLLFSGLGFAVYFAVADDPTPTTTGQVVDSLPAGDVSVRDEIAAAPMLPVASADATGGTPALGTLPTIDIPLVAQIGAEGIPTGYPKTPEGAVGQLGEILVSVLGSMDLTHAQRVQQSWFEDPTGSAGSWPVSGLIQSFLTAGRMPGGLEPGASLTVIPSAGQVKGSDGDGWHVVCVLVEITYTFRDQARLAYGHCERMTWREDRWLVGAGAHPVPGPSTWPGTELAGAAGWLTWRDA
ncbi:hypothetical protein H5399_17100 [Tessaracoccus sp. MC1627]|uniref:hypothetical protein n=1 Tax=Tessaracoccus sp. MC1627 TaxID=2760312 RepID=UPI0016018CAD|nr:hypothetical protein [Tessaracoccus sp. MC1627]MBB1514301.1 hypothetical protein [Tessaracoccus sp. MC1627]